MDESQERSSGFIVSGSNTAIVLHSVKEPFHFVTVLVQVFINAARFLGIAAGRDDNFCPQFRDELCQGTAVVAFIRYHGQRFVPG